MSYKMFKRYLVHCEFVTSSQVFYHSPGSPSVPRMNMTLVCKRQLHLYMLMRRINAYSIVYTKEDVGLP